MPEPLGDRLAAAAGELALRLHAGGDDDPRRRRAQGVEVGLVVVHEIDVLAPAGRRCGCRRPRSAARTSPDRAPGWAAYVGGERALVADDRDELAPCRRRSRAAGTSSWIARAGGEGALAVGDDATRAAARARRASGRPPGARATSASAFTAPPLLANRSTGPPPSASMTRWRSSACCSGVDRLAGSAFVLRSTPRGS